MSHPEASSSAFDSAGASEASVVRPIGRGIGLLRFWSRTLILPALAPLLVLAGIGYEAHSQDTYGRPGFGEIALNFAWVAGLVAGISTLRWLLTARGRRAAEQIPGAEASAKLAVSYQSGRIIALAGQLFFLTLLMPAGPSTVQYWALSVGAAYALLLLLDAPESSHPGALALVFLGLATTAWPAHSFSAPTAAAAPLNATASCLPQGLNLYGGCLMGELAPAVIALHVVLSLLLHFRRYAPAGIVLLALALAVSLLGASGAGRDSLIAIIAVILFFPSRPYSSAIAQFARGAFWLLGIVGFLLMASPSGLAANQATALIYPAFLVGLLFSEGLSAGLRSLGLHL